MGAQGNSTINFGAFPGTNEASVVVTGQAGIVAGSKCEAWVQAVASADYTAEDHTWLPIFVSFTCGDIVAGTGFTIKARSLEQMQGQWTVQWAWN